MYRQENSRDNKTAIELFAAGLLGWEAGLCQRIYGGTSFL
jgi:hypothetical protein